MSFFSNWRTLTHLHPPRFLRNHHPAPPPKDPKSCKITFKIFIFCEAKYEIWDIRSVEKSGMRSVILDVISILRSTWQLRVNNITKRMAAKRASRQLRGPNARFIPRSLACAIVMASEIRVIRVYRCKCRKLRFRDRPQTTKSHRSVLTLYPLIPYTTNIL